MVIIGQNCKFQNTKLMVPGWLRTRSTVPDEESMVRPRLIPYTRDVIGNFVVFEFIVEGLIFAKLYYEMLSQIWTSKQIFHCIWMLIFQSLILYMRLVPAVKRPLSFSFKNGDGSIQVMGPDGISPCVLKWCSSAYPWATTCLLASLQSTRMVQKTDSLNNRAAGLPPILYSYRRGIHHCYCEVFSNRLISDHHF